MLALIAALTLKAADGHVETVFPAHDRKATVVVFGLQDCPIVRQYAPEMSRLSRDYRTKGVRFVMAFADAKISPKAMASHMREFSLPFPAVRAQANLLKLAKATVASTATVFAADGRIVYSGRIDDRYPALGVQRPPRRADLRIALDAFLAGRRIVVPRTPVVGCFLPNG